MMLKHVIQNTSMFLCSSRRMTRSALPAAVVALSGMAFFGIGCTKSGSVGAKGGSPGAGGAGYEVLITKTYPTSQGSSWTAITSGGRTYIKGLDITVTGTCSRGIAVIKVDEGGSPYAETANCPDTGKFVWTKTYVAGSGEGDKTLTFTGYSAAGTAFTSGTAVIPVRIDNTAPPAPVVTMPVVNPYQHVSSSSAYTITGTVSADTVKLTGPAGVDVPISSGSWSYTPTLVDGASLNFSFFGFDMAGNQSATTTQTILWAATIYFPIADAFPGGKASDGGTGFTMESNSGIAPFGATDGATNFKVKTGFNDIANTLRAQ